MAKQNSRKKNTTIYWSDANEFKMQTCKKGFCEKTIQWMIIMTEQVLFSYFFSFIFSRLSFHSLNGQSRMQFKKLLFLLRCISIPCFAPSTTDRMQNKLRKKGRRQVKTIESCKKEWKKQNIDKGSNEAVSTYLYSIILLYWYIVQCFRLPVIALNTVSHTVPTIWPF